MGTSIVILERYIFNPEQVEYLYDLGVDSSRLIQYRYREKTVLAEDIVSIIRYKNNKVECGVRFSDGTKATVLADPDELFIKINDAKNGTVEDALL